MERFRQVYLHLKIISDYLLNISLFPFHKVLYYEFENKQVQYIDPEQSPVKYVNIVQTSNQLVASGSDDEQIAEANLATIEDSNGERQIVQVIREPIEGGIAIAEGKGEGAIYEFEQPQYIAIPNNSLTSLQVKYILQSNYSI